MCTLYIQCRQPGREIKGGERESEREREREREEQSETLKRDGNTKVAMLQIRCVLLQLKKICRAG